MSIDVDLRVDLNTEDDTGLPWAFVRDARDPALLKEGAWLVVGSGSARAVAQVVQIDGELVLGATASRPGQPVPRPRRRSRRRLTSGADGVKFVTRAVQQLSVVDRH